MKKNFLFVTLFTFFLFSSSYAQALADFKISYSEVTPSSVKVTATVLPSNLKKLEFHLFLGTRDTGQADQTQVISTINPSEPFTFKALKQNTQYTIVGYAETDQGTGNINLYDEITFFTSFVQNGECGYANGGSFTTRPITNLCNTGTPTGVSGSGPWEWQCSGQHGGSTSSCVAFLSVPQQEFTTSSPPVSTIAKSTSKGGIVGLMKSINRVILNPLILFMFALALAFFLYGTMQFVMNGANEEMKKSGKSHMLWGIIGMVIMVSVFGIMQIILNTVGEKHIRIDATGNYEVQKLK